MAKCRDCGGKAGFMFDTCDECVAANNLKADAEAAAGTAEEQRQRLAAKAALDAVVVSTAPSLEGYRIVRTIDVISAECVFGMNLFRDFFASLTDVFGGRSEASQKILRDSRRQCMYELRKEAVELGANAVIGVDLDYSEFSGGGKSMLFLVATGTAVAIEPIHPELSRRS